MIIPEHMPDLPDGFPSEFTSAWHQAGHIVSEAMQELLDRMMEDTQTADGSFLMCFEDFMSAAAAMGFSMGAEWRTLHPEASLELLPLDQLAAVIEVDHIMDENPG